jgi:hypothetical protein
VAGMFGGSQAGGFLDPAEDAGEAERERRRRDMLRQAAQATTQAVGTLGDESRAALDDLVAARAREGAAGQAYAGAAGLPGVGGDPYTGMTLDRIAATGADAWYRVLAAIQGPVAEQIARSDQEAFAELQSRLEDYEDELTRYAVTSNPIRRFFLATTFQEDPLLGGGR